MESLIKKFLSIKGSGSGDGSGYGSGYGYGSGSGSGDGSGSGYGSGSGSGSGYGYGSGSGDGSGDGYGDGSGSGDGIRSINNQTVHLIDGVQTIIYSIKGNVAKGYILGGDLTLSDCYVIKRNDLFAHGKTLRDANEALNVKLFELLPIEDRIVEFNKIFKDYKKKYSASLFFDWHNKLTGSCDLGRRSFCQSNGIDLDNGKYTVFEFIELTKNSYEGHIIKMLVKN